MPCPVKTSYGVRLFRLSLYMTAFEGHARTAEVLIAARADIKTGSNDGHTPLDVATQNGHRETWLPYSTNI